MKRYMKASMMGLVLLVLVLVAWQPTAAEPGATYELVGAVVGAGGTAVSGSYQIDGVVGQTAVGQHSSGDYELGSGFWGGGVVAGVAELIELYLPIILH